MNHLRHAIRYTAGFALSCAAFLAISSAAFARAEHTLSIGWASLVMLVGAVAAVGASACFLPIGPRD